MTQTRRGAIKAALGAAACLALAGCPDAVPVVVGMGGMSGTGGASLCVKDKLFSGEKPFPGGGPIFTLADVDGDKTDDVIAIGTDSSVNVLLNDRDGNLMLVANPSVKGTPFALATADVNDDGKIDLIVATDMGMDAALVMLGDGKGGFAEIQQLFIMNPGVTAIAVADVNNDKQPDIVYASAAGITGNSVGVFLNLDEDTGMFAMTEISLPILVGPRAIALADFDRDGNLDIAAATTSAGSSGGVNVLHGKGDGSFDMPVEAATAGDPVAIIAEDLDGDNRPDLAVADKAGTDVIVLLNKVEKTFEVAKYGAGAGLSIAAADLDDDGKLDLAIALTGASGGSVRVLLNDGGGRFSQPSDYLHDGSPAQVAAADLNRDGKADLAVTSLMSPDVNVLLNACP